MDILACVARPLRIEKAGGWYHVTARGNDRRAIYRDRRDMALWLGQRLCGLKLAALAAEVGLRNYGVVSTNIKRYERRLASDPNEQARRKRVLRLLNCEM